MSCVDKLYAGGVAIWLALWSAFKQILSSFGHSLGWQGDGRLERGLVKPRGYGDRKGDISVTELEIVGMACLIQCVCHNAITLVVGDVIRKKLSSRAREILQKWGTTQRAL